MTFLKRKMSYLWKEPIYAMTIDLAFLVDVTSHINDLNLKLQGKSKLFPSLVNDINAFNMKLKISSPSYKMRICANFYT